MNKNKATQSFQLFPDVEIEGIRRTISLGSIQGIEPGIRFASKITPAYPIFVEHANEKFKLINDHDKKTSLTLQHYSRDSTIEVIIVRNSQVKLVTLLANNILPLITGTISAKEMITSLFTDPYSLEQIKLHLGIPASKAGSKHPISTAAFVKILGEGVISEAGLKSWINNDKINYKKPKQVVLEAQCFTEEDKNPIKKNLATIRQPKSNDSSAENEQLISNIHASASSHEVMELTLSKNHSPHTPTSKQIELLKKWDAHRNRKYTSKQIMDNIDYEERLVERLFERLSKLEPNTNEFNTFSKNLEHHVDKKTTRS